MSEAGMRRVCFAGCCVLVRYDSDVGRRIVDFLYADVPEDGEVEAHVSLSIETGEGSDALSVVRDGQRLFSGDSEGALANFLLGETIYHLADKSRGGLVLHAAAVSHDGVGMILPGKTGAGKTTLTAWLAHSGFNYLTDELVYIEEGSSALETFTRPLNVKTGSLDVVRENLVIDADAVGTFVCSHATLIPHRRINPVHRRESPPLRVVVFPRYIEDAGLAIERLSKAQAGMRTMACLVNARNLPGHGFHEVARLAHDVDAYELRYSSFEQLGTQIEALLERLPS